MGSEEKYLYLERKSWTKKANIVPDFSILAAKEEWRRGRQSVGDVFCSRLVEKTGLALLVKEVDEKRGSNGGGDDSDGNLGWREQGSSQHVRVNTEYSSQKG